MLPRKFCVFRRVAPVLPFILFLVAGAHAQGRHEAELAKAEQVYHEGFFDQAIDLVNACLLQRGLTTAEQARAFKLLGQAYASKNEPHPARVYARKLLEVTPEYVPDPDQDLHMWIELVEQARQERERQIQAQKLPQPQDTRPDASADLTSKDGSKKWLWLGGGGTLIAAGIIYALVSQKEPADSGESTRFIDPPGRP